MLNKEMVKIIPQYVLHNGKCKNRKTLYSMLFQTVRIIKIAWF